MTWARRPVPAFGQVAAIILNKGGMLKSMQNLTWYAFTGMIINKSLQTLEPLSFIVCMS